MTHTTSLLALALPIFLILDRKSTRLNSSHITISYAVFCLKKKTELQSHHDLVCRLLLEKKTNKKKKKKIKSEMFYEH
mgnify:CR=1 FL=1